MRRKGYCIICDHKLSTLNNGMTCFRHTPGSLTSIEKDDTMINGRPTRPPFTSRPQPLLQEERYALHTWL